MAARHLMAVMDETPDLVATMDVTGRLLSLNRAGCRMLGVEQDEDVSRINLLTAAPEWAASLLLHEGIPTAIREGSWRGETALRTADGHEIPVSQVIVAHRQPHAGVAYLSTVVRDITERKRAEGTQSFLAHFGRTLATSLESESTLHHLTRLVVPRLADLCVVELVKDGKRVRVATAHADPGGAEWLRRLPRRPTPRGRAVGPASVMRTGEPELVPEVTESWLREAAADAREIEIMENLRLRSVIVVPLMARRRTIGSILLATAESGRRYEQADLVLARGLAGTAALAIVNARLYEESRRASRARDEMLKVVAHDLRNPLHTIALSAGLIQELGMDDRRLAAEQLEIITRTVEWSSRLIDDLLDVARMEAGQLSLELAAVDATALIREAVELHAHLAREKRLRLECVVPEALPAVCADRNRILQVLANLLGNAIKFTPEGGRITAAAEEREDEVVFAVADTGPGIPAGSAARPFERGWQAAPGTKSGIGFGLVIAKGLVEAHDGKIWWEPGSDGGAVFRFTLPVAREEQEP